MRFLMILIGALFAFEVRSAEFFPISSISPLKLRGSHWLDEHVRRTQSVEGLSAACGALLAEMAPWPLEGLFEIPEKGVVMGLFLAEGGSITNRKPHEYEISLPPAVFEKQGVALFEAYAGRPVVSFTLTEESWETPYVGWSRLFARKEVRKGLAQIRFLRVPASALPAVAASKSFPNVEALTVEARDLAGVLRVLDSGNFPKLRRLNLIASELPASELRRLLNHPQFLQVQELSFRMTNFGDEGLKILSESPALSGVSVLAIELASRSVCPNGPTEHGLRALLQSPFLRLKKLGIKSIWNLGPRAVEVLSTWKGLAALEYLELLDSQSDQEVARLLKTQSLNALEELRLEETVYDDKLLEAMAANPTLSSLKRGTLVLHADISRDAFYATLQAPQLAGAVIVYDIWGSDR